MDIDAYSEDLGFDAPIPKVDRKECRDCKGTGIFESGVCHCGQEMATHSNWDNHGATEMIGECPYCEEKK